MIKRMIAEGKTEQEILAALQAVLGISLQEARFMYGIETGKIVGDAYEIDEQGNKHPLSVEQI